MMRAKKAKGGRYKLRSAVKEERGSTKECGEVEKKQVDGDNTRSPTKIKRPMSKYAMVKALGPVLTAIV